MGGCSIREIFRIDLWTLNNVTRGMKNETNRIKVVTDSEGKLWQRGMRRIFPPSLVLVESRTWDGTCITV